MSSPRPSKGKVFRDNCIQGDYVKLSATAISIVDTPIFQRLRYLKQLGMTEFVYPGATHTRFAHSLGVAHRAREFAARLAARQPELVCTERDLIVLEVAGLCHDLGHGPFSHSFESELVPRLLPAEERWEHERMSCDLFDHICATYNIDMSADEQRRVKELIVGDRLAAKADWTGKWFHFDIVSNQRNGLDVDKLDYLKRDNAACGELTTSEFSSLYENMRVMGDQVCFRASVRSAVQDVYSARAKMHEFVYSHPLCKAVEYMVTDALLLAAQELGIREALRDPERFALLDDTVVRSIERSTSRSDGMLQAQELLRRLRHRDIYKHVATVDVPHGLVTSFPAVTDQDVLAHQDAAAAGVQLQEGEVRVHNLRIDFTARNESPLKCVGFFVNEEDEEPFSPQEVPFAPGTFVIRQVRLYLTRLCESCQEKRRYQEAAKAAFLAWSRHTLPPSARVLSPQKSALTASARKRHRPDSQQGTTVDSGEQQRGSMVPAPAAAPASAAAAAAMEAAAGGAGAAAAVEEDLVPVHCSQNEAQRGAQGPAGKPPCMKKLAGAFGAAAAAGDS